MIVVKCLIQCFQPAYLHLFDLGGTAAAKEQLMMLALKESESIGHFMSQYNGEKANAETPSMLGESINLNTSKDINIKMQIKLCSVGFQCSQLRDKICSSPI